MDLYYKVINNKYTNLTQVLKEEFGISARLHLKLKNAEKIYLNRK